MNKEVKHILRLAIFRYDAADDAHRIELLGMVGARLFVRLAETPQRLADFETAARIFSRYILFYYPPALCKHRHIIRSDGLDDCQDCFVRNY